MTTAAQRADIRERAEHVCRVGQSTALTLDMFTLLDEVEELRRERAEMRQVIERLAEIGRDAIITAAEQLFRAREAEERAEKAGA